MSAVATVAERSPISVLIVAPSLAIMGGQAVQASRLIKGLQESDVLKVGFLPHNPRLPGPLRFLQSIKYIRTVITTLIYFVSLVARVWSYDVVHIFSASYYSYLLCAAPAILVTRLYGKKSILNYRSGEAEDHLSRWRWTAAPVMRLADRIVVPSGYLVDIFQRFGLRARAVFNVVDTEQFGYREREPLRPVFLSNRNLEPLYNVECILKAFRKIQRRYPRARLIVGGDGTQRRALERRSGELALRNVEFVGQVTPEAMIELYRTADIYLNGSNIDNMPGSILEAFSSGLPVVTTNAGGIPYFVKNEETGLMVARGDAAALAAGALRLLEDAAFARKIIRNARAECARYRWSAVQGEWIKLYRELAARQPLYFAAGSASRPESKIARRSSIGGGAARGASSSRSLRVLLVAPSMRIVGGQSIQAEYLRSQLQDAAGLAVTLLPINPALPGPLRLLQRIKYVRTLLTTAVYIGSLVRRLPRYDIIHVFSASYLSFVLAPTPAILLARLCGKKIVLNYHSGEAEDHLNRWRRTAAPLMKMADEIVVPSGYLVEVFKRFGLRARPIFNVVDTEMFSYRERKPLRPVFLSNRNLESLYNVSCILRAFQIIQDRYPEARLIIAGDGKQRRALEREATDLGLRNTEFMGKVTSEVMSGLYREADIYLNSSNIDNMPGSILESFSSGLPVVTTDAGGIPYIVEHGETGLLVRRGDARGLAAGAIRLLQDTALARKIIIKARAASLRYSWSAVQDDWTSLYQDLAGRRRPLKSYSGSRESLEPARRTFRRHKPIDGPGAGAAEDGYFAPPVQSNPDREETWVIRG